MEPYSNQLPLGSSDTLEGGGLKSRSKSRADCSAGIDRRTPIESEPGEKLARVRLGSYEFRKKGVSRFDLRDPYHLAVTLTWPQFLAALLALYLAVNVVFATLFWLVPGSVANARPHNFGDAFFFSIETAATVGHGEMFPATLYGRVIAATEIPCGLALHGYDSARAIEADVQVFVTVEAHDPTIATTVHDIRNYAAADIRFGLRYTDALTTAADGALVLDLTRIGEMEPDVGDRREQGWTEWEDTGE